MSNLQLARALGWTSLAIGATELAATRWLEERLGVDDHHELIRAFGLREIAAGAMILNQPGLNANLAAGLWARVAGDAVDLAALALAVPTTRNPTGLAAIIGLVLGATGLDVVAAAGVQRDLARARSASAAARRRVVPTAATPNGAMAVVPSAAGENAVAI